MRTPILYLNCPECDHPIPVCDQHSEYKCPSCELELYYKLDDDFNPMPSLKRLNKKDKKGYTNLRI